MEFSQIEGQDASRIDDDSLAVCGIAADPSLQADLKGRRSHALGGETDRREARRRVDQLRLHEVDVAVAGESRVSHLDESRRPAAALSVDVKPAEFYQPVPFFAAAAVKEQPDSSGSNDVQPVDADFVGTVAIAL
jgi:hypothetical protein